MDFFLGNTSLVIYGVLCLLSVLFFLFIAKFAFYRKPLPILEKKKNTPPNAVSVILCNMHQFDDLKKNIDTYLELNLNKHSRIIVVDDNSSEEAKFFLNDKKKQYPNLEVIFVEHETKFILGEKYHLTTGIRESKQDILIFSNPNSIPVDSEWVNEYLQIYKSNEKTKMLIGYHQFVKQNNLSDYFKVFIHFYHSCINFAFALFKKPWRADYRNYSFKQSLFYEHRGYSFIQHLPFGEDDIYINRLGKKNNVDIVVDKKSFTNSSTLPAWGDWVGEQQFFFNKFCYYRTIHQVVISFYMLVHIAFWIFTISFLFSPLRSELWFQILFGVRFALFALVFIKASVLLQEIKLRYFIPLFDLLLCIYFLYFFPQICLKPANK